MTPRQALFKRYDIYWKMTPAQRTEVDEQRIISTVPEMMQWLRMWDEGLIREPSDPKPLRGRGYYSAREKKWFPDARPAISI